MEPDLNDLTDLIAASNVKAELLPTSKCFDNAMDYLEHIARTEPDRIRDLSFRLVHAIIQPKGHREPYAHAWVEETRDGKTTCIEGRYLKWIGGTELVYRVVDREEFHAEAGVIDSTAYTMRELLDHNRRTMSYGPWEQKYIDMTLEKKRERALHV